jgi:hypothetical protein
MGPKEFEIFLQQWMAYQEAIAINNNQIGPPSQ